MFRRTVGQESTPDSFRVLPALLLLALGMAVASSQAQTFYPSGNKIIEFNMGKSQVDVAEFSDPVNLLTLLDVVNLTDKPTLLLVGYLDYIPPPDFTGHEPGAVITLVSGSGAFTRLPQRGWGGRFSPSGNLLAYESEDHTLHVLDLSDNHELVLLPQSGSPAWSRDGLKLAYAQRGNDSGNSTAGGSRIGLYDLNAKKARLLTNGDEEDLRPFVHPSGDWVLFVSGSRTGLASFWRVYVNNLAVEQMTNVGKTSVDAQFCPTVYSRGIWSSDGRQFIFDFRAGDLQQSWMLSFTQAGELSETVLMADGLCPQWVVPDQRIAVFRELKDGVICEEIEVRQ